MNFQDEMKKTFLRVAAGEMEPEEWETWWNHHESQLEEILDRGDLRRIMPVGWSADYYQMTKTQKGVAYYFHRLGRPMKTSGYYEEKAEEEGQRRQREVMEDFQRQTAPERETWEAYLEKHKTAPVAFDWKSLLGTPPGQKAAPVFSYKKARDEEQWKETGKELKLRLKENIQAKIAPLAKAYGMKKSGPKTFVKEKNGLVWLLKFIGYFRGGGYEAMQYYICPVYAIDTGILGLPGHISYGENFQKMQRDWGVIQYGTTAVDAEEVEKINRKFDEILTFLAEGIFPEWEKIDSVETYFAKERLDYLKATETGPLNIRTGRPLWNPDNDGRKHPWRADDYLFGVWDLLSGRETEGYARLEECVEFGADYMESCLKERPDAYNDRRDPMAILYYNAGLFADTKRIADKEERRRKTLEIYEEVCGFMRYYHGLEKPVKR